MDENILVHQDLTSYGGLELLRRYFRLLDVHRRIRQAVSAYGLSGDYGGGRLVCLIITLFVVGARRLEHLRYLAHDPLVAGLNSERTVVNWLKQFTQAALQAVITLNTELLYEQVAPRAPPPWLGPSFAPGARGLLDNRDARRRFPLRFGLYLSQGAARSRPVGHLFRCPPPRPGDLPSEAHRRSLGLGEGGYPVGTFPILWAEWNGEYRDLMRRLWKGDGGVMSRLGYRLLGSSDLYESTGRRPVASVNFIACHDGFTLRDLVSYDGKHNEANGEDNRDGTDNNISWNCGAEGPTDDPAILALRARQQRKLLATLILSLGVPMITAAMNLGGLSRGTTTPTTRTTKSPGWIGAC